MNPVFEDKKSPETPVWRKRLLLTLIFAFTLAGLIAGGFFLWKSAAYPSLETRIGSLQTFFEKSAPESKVQEILCQGVIVTANRGNRVTLNGEAVEVGATIAGVTVVEITASNALLECNGKVTPLAPGESLIPRKR